MTKDFVKSVLLEHAADNRPSQPDLWPAIQSKMHVRGEHQPEQLEATGGTPHRRVPRGRGLSRWFPVTAPGWAALMLVLLLGAGAAAYAVAPLFVKSYVGVEHLEAAGMGRQVNLSQIVNGYKVSIGWVYADGNEVLVRYDISPSTTDKGLQVSMASPFQLTDDQGRVFPTISGGEQAFSREGASPIYAVFDTAQLTDAPASLNLRLTMNVQGRTSPSEMRKRITPGATPPAREMGPLTGPFIFSFNVPFIPVRVAHVGQTVKADGVAVTLDELRVSPSEARAVVRFDSPKEHADLEWRPTLDLAVGSWAPGMDPQGNIRSGMGARGGQMADGRWMYSWPAIPYTSQEPWTVSVTELTGYAPGLHPQITLHGPWTFKVSVPAAGQK